MAQLTVELGDDEGAIAGEFRLATDVKVTAFRNAPTTASFSTNAAEDDPAELVVDNVSRVLVHLDTTLVTNTLVLGSTDNVDKASESLSVLAACPLGAMIARRRRQNESAYGRAGTSRTWTAIDEAVIASDLISDENLRGDTFLRTSSVAIPLIGVLRTLTLEQGKPTLEALLDMANAFDGFDLAAIPFHAKGSSTMADLGIWASRGSVLSGPVLTYAAGQPSTIESFTRTVDGTKETSHQSVIGTAGQRVTSVGATQSGLVLDSEDSLSDVSDAALLSVLAQQLQSWRASPHEVLSITPSPTADLLPVRDFNVGDYIEVDIVSRRVNLTGLVRIYGWTLTRNAAGEARCESIVISPGDQGS